MTQSGHSRHLIQGLAKLSRRYTHRPAEVRGQVTLAREPDGYGDLAYGLLFLK